MLFLNLLLLGLPLALAHPPAQHRPDPHHNTNHHEDHHGDHHHQNDKCDYSAPGAKYFYLSDVSYESHIVYSTPAHLAVSYGSLAFNLTNNQAYDAYCSDSQQGGPGSQFSWPMVHECMEEAGATGNATWSYLGYSRELQVNETWACGGHNYLGYGTVVLDLQCETKSWTNPNYTWPTGEMYHTEDVTCQPLNTQLVPTVVKLN